MGYNGSLTANCWKRHICVNCGAVFRYFMTRQVTSQGATEEQARTNLQNVAVMTMENGVDAHPCPTCGMVQPEMAGAARRQAYGWLCWLAAGLTLVMAITMGFQFPISSITLGGMIGAALLALICLVTAFGNPNANLTANLNKARAQVAAQQLFLDGELENPPPRKTDVAGLTDGKHPVGFIMLGLALLLMVAPEGLRNLKGWKENSNWFPAVMGPGDDSTYYFHGGIHSIKGYWNGQVKAQLTSPGLDKPLTLTAKTQDNKWGDTISAKSSEENESVSLWTTVTMPKEASLTHQDASLELEVQYVAPVMKGSSNFVETPGKVSEKPQVHLATAGSAATYGGLGWLAVWGGGGLLTLAAITLYRSAGRMQGNPHEALSAE